MTSVEVLFWFCLLLVFYVYAGYPLLVSFLSIFFRSEVRRNERYEPTVTLLIAAYNEEKDIEEKLKNSFALDYPKDKFEIVVASDGSIDKTDEIVRRYADNEAGVRVVLHRVEGRQGKTAAQNSAVKICQGEIIIFSDAASMYERGVVRAMVRNYADPRVGAVSGMYKYVNKAGGSVGFATILFWNMENFIKSKQTRIRTITGCSGCIYSVRRDLYTDLPVRIISDLVEPLMILKKGFRIVFEPQALAYEETTGQSVEEFNMRIRVIVRGMNGILFAHHLLNPLKYPFVALQLISHKVMRWLVPVFCIVIFLTNAFLVPRSKEYAILFGLQVTFYLLAGIGSFLEKRGIHKKIFYLPFYFCIVNTAALISLFKVLQGQNIVTWQTKRD